MAILVVKICSIDSIFSYFQSNFFWRVCLCKLMTFLYIREQLVWQNVPEKKIGVLRTHLISKNLFNHSSLSLPAVQPQYIPARLTGKLVSLRFGIVSRKSHILISKSRCKGFVRIS